MEFVRDRGTFFWNLLFPVLMVAGFAFAFSGDGKTLFKVALAGDRAQAVAELIDDARKPDANPQGKPSDGNASVEGLSQMEEFLSVPELKLIVYDDKEAGPDRKIALDKLRKHQIDMLVDFDDSAYYINDRSSGSGILKRLVDASGANGATRADGFIERAVSGDAIRYVDWLVPGVIGMNMMFSCLFGVGFVLVRYRKNGVLKRLKATPVGALNFLFAQAMSRMVIAFATSVVVFAGTNAFLHFRMEGSYLPLVALLLLAILSMISLGLVFAARFKSEELASGLLNLVTFPMMIFSGVFFSLEGSPQALRNAAKAFPLTHFLEGARAVMIDGAGFATVWPQMAILAAMSAVFLAVSTALFKWE